MQEKLQEYALIAEIVGAVAIVLSLIFVGIQVKQGAEETAVNTEAIRGQVRESMMNADLEVIKYIAEYMPEDDRTLSNTELFYEILKRTRENYWVQYQNGLLDEDTYTSYISIFIDEIQKRPSFKRRWDGETNNSVVPTFKDEVNSILKGLDGN